MVRYRRGHAAELLCAGAGDGLGGVRDDHRGLLHRQPRRLPRAGQAADQPQRHQRPQGESCHLIHPINIMTYTLLKLRNPVENFTYATVKGSAVDMYFRRQVCISTFTDRT